MNDERRKTAAMLRNRQAGTCAHCGVLLPIEGGQLAHLVPQRKYLLKLYGKEIIHHPDNLRLVCSLRCNAAVQMTPLSVPANKLMEKIKKKLKK